MSKLKCSGEWFLTGYMIRPSPCYSETFLSLGGGSVGHGASFRGAFAPNDTKKS